MAHGRFIPKNPAKYIGNPNTIMWRSSWELRFMQWLDANNAVARWASEELSIPYVSPLDSRMHKYYPDFIIFYQDKFGQLQKEIVEIKPYKQSVQTKNMSDKDKATLLVNEAKWVAAAEYAAKNGAKFRVITEKTIFYSKSTVNKKKIGTSV